ncbi:MAG TPA: branched-chain amino acid ABC transporter substrate-binding protein [Candidatus Baltobacteraceae bacterium]
MSGDHRSTIGRRGFLGGAAAGAAALCGVPARAQFAPGIPTTTITLGVAGPFSGDDRHLGEQLANGVRQAVYDANQLQGIFNITFNMRTFDDQDMLADAITTAGLAVDDATVVCIIGHMSGRVTEAATNTYVKAQMPVIVPTSTYDRLTEYGYGGIIRLATKDTTEGSLAAKYAEDTYKPSRMTVLYQDGDYGFDVANGFAIRSGADKIPCASVKVSWDKPQFDDAAAQTIASNPDFVYLAGVVGDMGPLLDSLRAAKYTGPIGASQGFFASVTPTKYPTSAEGLVISTSIPPYQLAPADYQIIQDFRQNYGEFTSLSAFGYAGAQVAISAIRRTGLVQRLGLWRTLQLPGSYDTVIGTLRFFSTGDQIDPNVYFYQVTNGAWKYLRPARTATFLAK